MRRSTPITRSAIVRHPPKRKPGYDDPQFRSWLKSWPCWICFNRYCADSGYDAKVERQRPEVRALAAVLVCCTCGPTEVAHVGIKGLSQRCRDREAMPLGRMHHLHPTAGGGPDSYHAASRTFWTRHNLDREEVLAELHLLYWKETGRIA